VYIRESHFFHEKWLDYVRGSVQLKKKFAQCLLSKDKKVKIV